MANYSAALDFINNEQLAQKTQRLMHQSFTERKGSLLTINEKNLISFVSCSYLGLDSDPRIKAAAINGIEKFGVNYCCARTRLSIQPLIQFEEELSTWMTMPTVTFPSVSVTHLAILPLIADGVFSSKEKKALLIFDRFSHASMQSLMPMLQGVADVQKIAHNDLNQLESICKKETERDVYYFCDSLYSMGGAAPIKELLELSDRHGLFLYVDDAHGTSIFGKNGQGYVASILGTSPWPDRLFVTLSLSKGFGCSGGAITLPTKKWESALRKLSTPYLFSGGIDIANICAGLESLRIHQSPELSFLQADLRHRINFYDQQLNSNVDKVSYFPIKTIEIKDESRCIELGQHLTDHGFFVNTSFFPVVAKGNAKIRLCLTRDHSIEDITKVLQLTQNFLK